MSRLAGPFGVIAVVILAVAFASQNGSERVTLDFGFFVFYGVPVTLVAFGGLFLGMLVMLGAGIQSDLKVRSILRDRLAAADADEPDLVDHSQRDLFLHAPPVEPTQPKSVETVPASEPWLPEPPATEPPSIDDLAPSPESAPRPEDPPAEPGGPAAHPAWRDMEHGDPMD